jgi:hypothetical protein
MRRRKVPREDIPQRKSLRYEPGPIPTLGDLTRLADWLWLHCRRTGCHHYRRMKLAPIIDRWGADASSDRLRRQARCTKCGNKGANTMVPSCDGLGRTRPFESAEASTWKSDELSH